jgi:hypothetical protein
MTAGCPCDAIFASRKGRDERKGFDRESRLKKWRRGAPTPRRTFNFQRSTSNVQLLQSANEGAFVGSFSFEQGLAVGRWMLSVER